MPDDEKEWFVGDRVHVQRICKRPGIELTIMDFGDEDENPIVTLLLQEWKPVKGSTMKRELIRKMVVNVRFDDMEDPPLQRTKGGAQRRWQRGMAEIKCQCGCGLATSGGMFRQGHDAKLKSKLRKVMDGRIEGDPDAARGELERRGWL